MIVEGANSVGILRDIKGKTYVDLSGMQAIGTPDAIQDQQTLAMDYQESKEEPDVPDTEESTAKQNERQNEENRRVFVTHGKNRAFIEPIKKLLGFGEMEPVVSVDRTSISQPVPDKVMNEMRSCSSAIIHVDAEKRLIDQEANEHILLNPNVLIEIGAAMALYGRRFVLLVRDGVKLPSNLQGLFEVRYTGEVLDGDATIKLLEAINDIKNHPMPDRYSSAD